jgi:hypothetical protein
MESARQLVAIDDNGFGLFAAGFGLGAFATDCHRLQPLGSIKAPYSARHENDFIRAGPGGIALSEERQLNGYRVRLRVVEEYDVALLAESPDDAKARVEADLRKGDQWVATPAARASTPPTGSSLKSPNVLQVAVAKLNAFKSRAPCRSTGSTAPRGEAALRPGLPLGLAPYG